MLANRLRISPLVGYLAAGVLAGPFTPGFVADTSLAPELAEIGVILLMFGVGLHFSLKDLLAVKSIAIPGAVAQIAVATLLGMGLSKLLGWDLISGLVFGLCLSTASTVVLLRALEERQLIDSQRGQIAIGWLIVEDLAMVLTLVLLPAFGNMLGNDNASSSQLLMELALTIGKVIAFIALMIVVGRRLVPWILSKTASTGSRELFTLAVLALALGIAYGAVKLFDVSFALGAFFAGMVLNESELSHRAAHDTLPLRDAFAVLFFVSVGMLFDPMIVINEPLAVLATLAIIVFGKSAAAFLLVKMFGHSKRTALTISASLAQIGEFAFILAGLGIALGMMSEHGRNLVLAGAILSIMLNPLLFTLLERYLAKTETIEEQILEEAVEEEKQIPVDMCNHALVVGYGRVGSLLGGKLAEAGIPLVVIENSRPRVEALREQGIKTVLGNAANPEVMDLARLDCARWLLLTIPNGYEAGEIVASARTKRPNIEIIARAHYDDEVAYITDRGANQVVMGEREIANSMLNILQLDTLSEEEKWAAARSEAPRIKKVRHAGPFFFSGLTLPVGLFQAVFPLRQAAREAWRMLVQHLVADAVGVFAHLRQGGVGQVTAHMLAGVRHVVAVIAVGGDIVQQRRQRAVAGAVGVHDLLRPAHIRRDMRINAQRIFTVLAAHGATELVAVELGDMPRQQRVLGLALIGFFGVARHIQAIRPGGAQHQIHPLQRHVRGGQRIAQPGQLQRFVFVHRQNRHIFLQEVAPPLRVVGNDVLGTQGQHHRHIVFLAYSIACRVASFIGSPSLQRTR